MKTADTIAKYGFAVRDGKTEYLPSGVRFFEKLKQKLKMANSFILLEFFRIEKGILLDEIIEILCDRAKNGVKIKIIYDSIGCLFKFKGKDKKKLKGFGIELFKFKGNIFRQTHRKIAVIDGKYGFLGGVNIGDEYVNLEHPYGHWRDSGIMVEGDAVVDLTTTFLECLRFITKKDIEGQFLGENNIFSQKIMLFHDRFHKKHKPYLDIYFSFFKNVQNKLFIATPYLNLCKGMVNRLIECTKRGVEVILVIPNVPDKKAIYQLTLHYALKLHKAGIKIHKYGGFLHNKMLLCENAAITGTLNFNFRSFFRDHECAAYLIDNPCVEQIKTDFEDILSKSQPFMPKRQSFLAKFVAFILRIFQRLI